MIDLKKINRIISVVIAALLLSTGTLSLLPGQTQAAVNDQGVDLSIHNGYNARFGYAHDKFAILQVGGYQYGLYDQPTYNSQVASTIAQGKRAHTYLWWEGVGDYNTAKMVLDYFLPKVQTPKGSIVAIDAEKGFQNTDLLMWALNYIKQAGYTPMLYGYKDYLVNNVDLARISKNYQLWLAEYPDYNLTPTPNYNFFPSYDNIGIFQFTSTYAPGGGLDGNIDLTGITDNGYTKHDNPKTQTPAINQGKTADNTPKTDIQTGFKVKVNFSANSWATGEAIPSWIKGNTYEVKEVSGNKVLLSDVLSWIDRSNVEIIQNKQQAPTPSATTNQNKIHIVATGETLGSIAEAFGTTYQNIAAWNGLSNPNLIYPGQSLIVGHSSNIYQESGSFVPNTAVNVRTSPSTGAVIATQYDQGQAVYYDGYTLNDGYVWIHYKSYTGHDRYIAVRNQGGNAWGYFY